MRHYIAVIHKENDSDYGVSFPDLPGCFTAGSTLDEARAMAVEVLALHLEGMSEKKEPVPEPSSLEEVMANAVNRDGVAILVPAPDRPAKTVRVNITLPEEALQAIDRFAEAHGFTRSGFLTAAARRAMAEDLQSA
jgi:predicted RNase H-like HicB family nuclease